MTTEGERRAPAELEACRRFLWLAVSASGGRVVLTRAALEAFDPERSTIVVTPSNVDGSTTIEAKIGPKK